MILGQIFAYNKNKYFVIIAIGIIVNTFLHPIATGVIPEDANGNLDFTTAFATNFVTWAISFNILGVIIGLVTGVFKNKRKEPLAVRNAKAIVSSIFYIQIIFGVLHIFILIRDLIF